MEVVGRRGLQGGERGDLYRGLDVANGASVFVLEWVDDTAKFVYMKTDVPHEALSVITIRSSDWLYHVFYSTAVDLRVCH